MITNAGFIDVEEKKFKVPVGTWPKDPKLKELGQWNLLFCLEGLESWSLYLLSMGLKVTSCYCLKNLERRCYMTRVVCCWADEKQWSYEEIQVHIMTMRKELLKKKNHAYYDMYAQSCPTMSCPSNLLLLVINSLTRNSSVVYGRKPGGPSEVTNG